MRVPSQGACMKNVFRWAGGAGAIGLAALALGAWSGEPNHPTHPRPVPAPTFSSIESATRGEIVAYASSLVFDTSYHAIDTRRLAAADGTDPGSEPLVTIAPEIGIVPLSDADLAKGRIIARLTASGSSARYGLAKGENYLWMDSQGGEMRAFLV